jgi:hypothetical protein
MVLKNFKYQASHVHMKTSKTIKLSGFSNWVSPFKLKMSNKLKEILNPCLHPTKILTCTLVHLRLILN